MDGQCSRIEIEPAENGGFSVRKFYRPPKASATDGPSVGYTEPKTFAFSTLEELSTFLHGALGAGKARITKKT